MSGAANKKDKSVGRSFVDIINGNFLTKDDVLRHLPFFMFLCLLALVYIANGYMAEDTVRKLNNVGKEVKEFRSEYITTKSELMYKSKQSELADFIDQKGMGLKESFEPPRKIKVSSQNLIED
jgi:hypothetical protein